jgi:hypothetical protein
MLGFMLGIFLVWYLLFVLVYTVLGTFGVVSIGILLVLSVLFNE